MSPRKATAPMPLVDVPASSLDHAAALSEVLAQRQEELDRANHQLNLTHAQIRLAQHRWEQQQGAERQQADLKRQAAEAELETQRSAIEQQRRQIEAALESAMTKNAESTQRLLELQAERTEFSKLAKERFAIAILRQQAEAKMTEAQTLWSQARAKEDDATMIRLKADAVLVDCERRNREMVDEWNRLTAWQQALTIRERDVQVLNEEVDRRMAAMVETQPEETHAAA